METICLKVRLYPTKAQETVLITTLDTCRILYNRFLAQRKDAYEQTGKSPSRYDQVNCLPSWKKENEYLQHVHSQVLQEVAGRIDRSFRNFFRRCKQGDEKVGYPRFKGRGYYDSFTFPQVGFSLNNESVTLSKIGEVKAVVHRRIEGKIKQCTIRRRNDKWFACFSIETESKELPVSDNATGIDVGIASFATLSSSEQIANPHFLKQDEKALAKAQRRLSKFEKGTPERKRCRKVVARIHERIRNRRHNFTHQTARRVVDEFGVIAVEKLRVKNMSKRPKPKKDEATSEYLPNGASAKAGLNKSIGDAAWTQFRTVLSHKAVSAGRKYMEVDPRYTSQDCHQCGHRAKKKLSQRWYFCPICSASLDRDHNAALNILSVGLHTLGIQSVEAPAFMRGE